ncbi:MAG: hypothetical protein HY927_16000 [Elusimicrobia bacterium]|nr:hypothetical protein [Elusimicrobiota bacterium]
MKCPNCASEQPDGAASCGLCGFTMNPPSGVPALSIPPVGASIPAAGPDLPAGPQAGGAQGGKPAAGRRELVIEPITVRKRNPFVSLVPGVLLLVGGWYFMQQSKKRKPIELGKPVAVKDITLEGEGAAPVAAPDPAILECRKALVGQGATQSQSEAHCSGGPGVWAKMEELSKLPMDNITQAATDAVTDLEVLPVKGGAGAEGRQRAFFYVVLYDAQGLHCAAKGRIELSTSLPGVGGFLDMTLQPASFRRGVIPGETRETVHAIVSPIEFEPAAVAGKKVVFKARFDGRVEAEKDLTF